MKKILLLLAVIFSSCAPYIPISQYEEKNDAESNVVLKKEIGNSVITYHSGHYAKAIRITEGSAAKDPTIKLQVNPGEVYIHLRTAENKEVYFPEGSKYVNGFINASKGIMIDTKKNTQSLYALNGYAWGSRPFANPIKYEPVGNRPDPDPSKPYFEKSLLYNGKTGNTLKFSYREFSNDYARPAFTQELTYDLNESNVIGFQGMRIEVIKASNTDIEYKILNGFTK